jgi:hypothetical protein
LVEKLHNITVDYAKKNPGKINLSKLDEIDEQLRQKLYAVVIKEVK